MQVKGTSKKPSVYYIVKVGIDVHVNQFLFFLVSPLSLLGLYFYSTLQHRPNHLSVIPPLIDFDNLHTFNKILTKTSRYEARLKAIAFLHKL